MKKIHTTPHPDLSVGCAQEGLWITAEEWEWFCDATGVSCPSCGAILTLNDFEIFVRKDVCERCDDFDRAMKRD